MVFANGSTVSNWRWAAVKAIKVTEEEKKKYPIDLITKPLKQTDFKKTDNGVDVYVFLTVFVDTIFEKK